MRAHVQVIELHVLQKYCTCVVLSQEGKLACRTLKRLLRSAGSAGHISPMQRSRTGGATFVEHLLTTNARYSPRFTAQSRTRVLVLIMRRNRAGPF